MRALLTIAVIGALPLDLAAQEPARHSNWDVTVGTGAIVVPRYTGSEQYQVWPMPVSQVTYRDRVYLGPSTIGTLGAGLGAYLLRTGRFRLAAEVGLGPDRPASRADPLAGTDDRDFLTTAGTSLTYDTGPFHAGIAVARGLNDHAGSIGAARLGFTRFVGGHLMAITDVTAAFADARQMRREFGVTPVEAARRRVLLLTGDPRLRPDEGNAYRPGGGLSDVGGSVTLVYGLTRHWSAVGVGAVSWLSDEANASPIVRQRDQVVAGLGLAWRR
jgi:outer membrane scaffolding protein for murein synthesis (MipA/OmpV family)